VKNYGQVNVTFGNLQICLEIGDSEALKSYDSSKVDNDASFDIAPKASKFAGTSNIDLNDEYRRLNDEG